MKDTAIPYRIASIGEQPISREYWFTKEFTGKYQTINGLLRSFLKGHNITPVYVLEQLWFQWQGRWCKCDYEIRNAGKTIDYYLLEYIQN